MALKLEKLSQPRRHRYGFLKVMRSGLATLKSVKIIVNQWLLGEELELSRAFTAHLRKQVRTVDYMFQRLRETLTAHPHLPQWMHDYSKLKPAWRETKVWVDEILFYKEAQLEIFGE